MIFSLYIFDRQGKCLLYRGWNQKNKSKTAIEHEKKLVFGLLFSAKAFVNKMAPRKLDETENEPLYSFTTKDYKLHYLETLTGLRFAMTTAPSVGRIIEVLQDIYRLYVDYVIKNPLHRSGGLIQSPLFVTKLEQMVEALSFF